MNSNCYKIIFSKRLGTLVAVGEHTTSTGKAASGQACRAVVSPSSFAGNVIDGFVGLLKLSFASVTLACLSLGVTQAQSNLRTVASTTLPQNGVVNQGSASISTHGSEMAITQTTDKASINWQSFSIGTAASVNIAQPSASSVLLNRVTGNDPSQILGKLSANGQLILLNPNGVVFGKDGSVTASAFTASTFGLNDADFMNGFYKYKRNGSTAAVVNQGTIEVSSGGFVALMGATVTNEGKIIAPQGDVVLAAGDSVTLPEELVAPKQTNTPNTISVRMGKRVRLELDPASINTAVNNTESGVIVTEGGQVLLQSAALSSAVASVTHSGVIDTSAPQAGAVTVLAENGNIKVDGTIKSNSTGNTNGTANRGGDIIIGRDEETGALSKSTDVRAAKLESSQGFVETSGQHITVDGVQVKAAQWLLDPTDITITAADSGTASSGTNPITLAPNTSGATASTVSVSTLESNLSAGTSVIVKTTNASGTGNGDITVASNIAVTGTTDATLTLQAERDIVVNSNVSIARTGTNKLNVVLNSDLDGNGAGAIVMNSGSSINSNGGNITLGGGTAGTGSDYARGYTDATRFTGVSLTSTTLNAAGGDVTMKGKGNATFTNSNDMRGVNLSGTAISTTGSGNITIDGVGGNGNVSGTNVGIGITGGSTITGASGGTVTLTGTATNGALYNFGFWVSGAGSKVTSTGHVLITGTSGAAVTNAHYNDGVMIQNSAEVSTTGSGNLTITGTAATSSGTYNHGVNLAGSSTVSTANGTLSITGQTGTQGSSSFGVAVGSGTQVRTTGGDIFISGTSGISGQYGYGFWVGDNYTKISAGGNGNITINGTSTDIGSSDALGMQIRTAGSIITNNGNISLTGTSRGTAGNSNIGISFTSIGSAVAGGSGSVTLVGTGGSTGTGSVGVNNAVATTAGGAINITGASSSTGTSSEGITANGALNSSGGAITLTANSYAGSGTETINAGTGSVTIQNRTAGTLIDVGSTSADVISGTLKLGVSSAELARITAATVVVGRNDGTGSGNVNLSATNLGALGNTAGNLTVLSGNNIAINGAITKSTGTDATLTLNAVNGIDITNAAASVGGTVAGAGKLNVAMTANGNAADAANSSGLVLSKVINANGGSVSLVGTNKKSTGGSSNSGVRLSGASIYAASLNVTGNQTGTNAGSDTNGIYISGTNTLQTTSGTSTLTGNSNAFGNLGGGIFFADSSSTTLDSGSGSMNFSGLNSNTGYRGIRIGGSNNASINAKGNISFEDTQTQVMLRGQLTQQTNSTVSFKGKGVSLYAGTSVVKAAGATGTTLNLEAQTVVVGEAGNADLTADTINLTGNTTGAGTTGVQINNASTLTSSGATTITASGPGTSLNAGSSATIAATGGLTVNINNAGTLASQLTGGTANAGGLTKSGAGTLTVGNTNTHQGTTLVSAGTLLINNVNALQNSTLDTGTSGAQQVSFGLAGTNTYNFGSIQGADALSIGANTISVGSNNSSTTYSGVLSGTGDLTKVGTGNLTLSGQSTKTGSYNANAGTLTLTGASGTYRELNGLNVNINNGATVSIPNVVNGGFVSTNVIWTFGSAGGGTLGINANFVNRGSNGNKFVTTGGATNTINGNINLDFATNLAGPTFDVADGTGGVAGLIHSGVASNGSATQGLTKLGVGKLILTGSNDYKGPVTVSAGTLQLGNAGTTGMLGATSGTVTLASGSTLQVNRSNAITLSNTITGAGNLIQSGTGTLTLTGNNNYSGTTSVSAGTLQVGSGSTTGSLGSGAVTLSNNANLSFVRSADTTISNAISGTGNVSTTITGSGSDLTVNGTINLTDGLINLAADGNMTLAAAVGTGNASSSAVILNAGKSTSAGSSSGGDLILSGSGTVTVGSGGRATLMTGSVAGSTGLATLVGVGNSRYNSDELSTGYTQAIGSSGLYAIYRESPSLTVTLTNDSKTYNTLAYSGGNGYTVSSTVNGDAAASMGGSIVYGGTAQNAINAGTYTITGSGLTNSLTSLGYTLAYTAGTLTVGKAALTATANSGTATYNGYDQSLTGSYSVAGLLGSDTTAGFVGISSAGVTAKNAGTYTNTITVADQTNYTVTGADGTFTIGKAALTATGNSSAVTYNGGSQTVSGFTVSGLKGTDAVGGLVGISASGASAQNAGSYANTMTVVDQTNYTVTGVNGALTIGKAALVATANSGSVTYNGNDQTISGFSVAGLLGSDTVGGLTGVSASGVTGKNFGSYTNTMTVADQTNYTVTGVNGSLSVGKANLTLSGTRVYDGGTSFAGAFLTASGVNSETFALTGSGDASNLSSKHVQSSIPLNSVTGLTLGSSTNGGISSNYNALTTTGSSVSVTARTATVSATPTTLTYNGATQQQTAETSSGFISGDNITITGNASGKNANTYASNLSVTGADAGNYNITLNNANLVIDKAQLLVTASQATKTYDNSLSASGSGTVGTLAGASAGNALSDNGTQAFLDKNAGINKTVRASGVAIKDASNADVTNNYDLVYVDNTTSSISKAALTVIANNDARFVTLSDTAGYNGVSYSGFVGGETNSVLGGTLSVSRTNASTNVGAQTYTGVLVASGLTSNNYTIGYTNGNYTIVPAGSLLIRSANETLTYGTATPNFSTTAQYLDGSNVIHTLSRTGSGNNYTFSDGAGGSVAVQLMPYSGSSLATTSTSGNTIVGNYDIKDTNPTIVGSNFSGTPVFVGVETVNTKAVTPNATNVSKVYDGSTSMSNVVVGFTGNIINDDLSITGNGAFSQKNVGQNLSYTISGISLSGADAANYTLSGGSSSFTGTNGTITPATLVISSSDVTKVYDRTSTAAGTAIAAQGTQVFGTDALSGGSFAFADVNVGTSNKVMTVSGVTVSDGNNGDNYVVSYVDNTTSTITPKALTASYTATNKAYDGNTTATVTGASSDIISGDTVNLSNTSATFDTKNAGLAKTVSVAGISISGSEAGNYSLQNTSATTTADITKKDVTLTAGNVSKTYDGTLVYSATPSDLTPFTSQLVSGDTATAAIISFANKNAGAGNKTVTLDHVTVSDGNSGGNYNLTLVGNTTSTITPAALTIKVNDTAMFVTQDANTATNQGFSYTGFKNGETATTALSGGALTIADRVYTGATNFPVAGSYTGVYGLNNGVTALNGNYTIAVQNGNLTVTPADKLLITVASQTEAYGTRSATNVGRTAAGTVTAEYCLSAVNCNGANLVSLTTTKLSDTQWKATDNTGSYVLFDTSTQTPTYSSGGYLNAGNYGLTATEIAPISLPNGNFTGRATNGGVLTITPRAVSTSASAVSKTYDGSTQQFSANVTIDNAALNDVVTLTANTSVYASKDVGNNMAVTLNALGLSGTDAANYYLPNSSVSTTGSITPKALSLTGSRVANKVFDGNTQASVTAVGSLQGLVGTEVLGLANIEGAFNTPSVGTNKQVSITAVLQDGSNGGLASNYTLTPGSAYADITAASNGAESGRNIIVPPKPFISSNTTGGQTTGDDGGGSGSGGGSAGSNPYTVIPNNRRDSSADKCTATSLEACVCDAQGASAVDGVAICYQPQKAASNQTSKPRRI